MKLVQIKKSFYIFFIVCGMFSGSLLFSVEKTIEQIKKEVVKALSQCETPVARDGKKIDVATIITDLEEWGFSFLDIKNNESKAALLAQLQTKMSNMQAVIKSLEDLAKDTSTKKESKAVYTRVFKELQKLHDALRVVHNILGNYNSTERGQLLALGMSLLKYNHLLPEKVRSRSTQEFNKSMVHRLTRK